MHGTNQEIKECIDLRACAYTNWYKKFRKITLDSVCIPLSAEIVKYLLDEIIILPKECYGSDKDESFGGETDDDDDDDDIVVSILNQQFVQNVSIKIESDCWIVVATGISRVQCIISGRNFSTWWSCFCENQLEQSERCILDNRRPNDVLQRHHRHLSIAQGVWHL